MNVMGLHWDDVTARFNAKYRRRKLTAQQLECALSHYQEEYWNAMDAARDAEMVASMRESDG